MKKINVITAIKGLGLLLSIGGMIATSVAGEKEKEKLIEEAVEKRLQQK